MRRRDLLKAIAAIPIGIIAGKSPESFSQADDFEYKGFLIQWRGWTTIPNMDFMIGKWIATNLAKYSWHIYSCYPGATSRYWPGQIFNTSLRSGQEFPQPYMSEDKLKSYKQNALKRILKYIDHNEKLLKEPWLKEPFWEEME